MLFVSVESEHLQCNEHLSVPDVLSTLSLEQHPFQNDPLRRKQQSIIYAHKPPVLNIEPYFDGLVVVITRDDLGIIARVCASVCQLETRTHTHKRVQKQKPKQKTERPEV